MNEWNFNEHKKCKNDAELIYEKTAETLRLEATANGIKKMKSELNIFLVSN